MKEKTTLKVITPQDTLEEKEKRTIIQRTQIAETKKIEVETESDVELSLQPTV